MVGEIPPLPLLTICDQQTAGRGQPGKSWASDQNSLTFTWCDSEKNILATHSLLPMIVGVSVCEALELLEIPNAKLKWPNDVMLNQRKVCGILVERIPLEQESVFLIGVGINLNQDEADLKQLAVESSRFQPGSLRIAANRVVLHQAVLEAVLSRLHENVRASVDWASEVEGRLEFLNETIEFARPNGEVISGTLVGIDAAGYLRIQTGSGPTVPGGHDQGIESGIMTLSSGRIL